MHRHVKRSAGAAASIVSCSLALWAGAAAPLAATRTGCRSSRPPRLAPWSATAKTWLAACPAWQTR